MVLCIINNVTPSYVYCTCPVHAATKYIILCNVAQHPPGERTERHATSVVTIMVASLLCSHNKSPAILA